MSMKNSSLSTIEFMNNYESSSERKDIRTLMKRALIIRAFVCLLVLLLGTWVFNEIYFIEDDMKYEQLAEMYMQLANHPIDMQALKSIGASNYLQVFWPYAICIAAYISRTVYAGRILNVLLSAYAVKLIYVLVKQISGNHHTAMRAAKLYAYLPYPVLVCSFPIKDIFLTTAVLYSFVILVKYQNGDSIKAYQWMTLILMLIGVYFTRGGVVELLLAIAFVYVIKRFADKKNFWGLGFSFVVACICVFLWGGRVVNAFSTKVDQYGSYALMDTTISAIQMSSPSQFYKLPFTYFFASLQPIALSWFSSSSMKTWSRLMYYLNLTIIPVACGNFMYIFSKKKNFIFWITSTAMYCGVATLSLGIFRHYLFLLPLQLINYSLYMEKDGPVTRNNCLAFSIVVYLALLCYSVINVL